MNKNIKENLKRFSEKDSYSYLYINPHLLRRKKIVKLVYEAAARLSLINKDKELHLTEIGVGNGVLIRDYKSCLGKLNLSLRITGVDLSGTFLNSLLKEGVINEAIIASVEELPLTGESQDIVVMSEVLEHLQTPFLGLKEVYRILKPKGFFIGSVPNAAQLWDILRMLGGLAPHQLTRKIFDPTFTHESHFTSGLLKKALRQAGFRHFRLMTNFIRLLPKSDWHPPLLNFLGNILCPRFGDRLIWICRK